TSCAYTVTATHTFGEEGGEAFTVTVTDARSQATSIPSTATVADALVQTTAAPASAVAGTPLAGVVASFTDEFAGAPVTDFTATVDWGDGAVTTDPTIAAASGGAFTVSAAHTYARAGPFRTTILVRDKAGSAGSAGGTITVTAPSPPPGGATSLPPPPPKPAAPGSPPSLDVSAPRPAGTQTLSLRVACPATASRCLGVARIVTLPSHAKKSPLPGGTSLGSALFVLAPGGSRILYIPVARRLRLILHHAHSARLAGVAIAFAANGQSAAETGPVAAVSTVGLR
ncbi:MAG: large repetitive protein, partial [Solirubrobacteraceae bacterium]|nr:large repetitive protein [Solirubrobacteraceae bacterium]